MGRAIGVVTSVRRLSRGGEIENTKGSQSYHIVCLERR